MFPHARVGAPSSRLSLLASCAARRAPPWASPLASPCNLSSRSRARVGWGPSPGGGRSRSTTAAPSSTARPSKMWGGGAYHLVYGGKGEVTGPATSKTAKGKGVRVQFPAGNSTPLGCLLTQLSRTAPPTTPPGGYRVGDEVFFAGGGETFPDSDRLVYGGKGEVTGPATLETHKGKGASVQFPGNKTGTDCLLIQLSRTAPLRSWVRHHCLIHMPSIVITAALIVDVPTCASRRAVVTFEPPGVARAARRAPPCLTPLASPCDLYLLARARASDGGRWRRGAGHARLPRPRSSTRGRARRSRAATAWCTAARARSPARPPPRRPGFLSHDVAMTTQA